MQVAIARVHVASEIVVVVGDRVVVVARGVREGVWMCRLGAISVIAGLERKKRKQTLIS